MKKRQDKLIKEAEAAQEFKWKLEDRESDTEVEEKMRKFRGEPASQRGLQPTMSTAETDKKFQQDIEERKEKLSEQKKK